MKSGMKKEKNNERKQDWKLLGREAMKQGKQNGRKKTPRKIQLPGFGRLVILLFLKKK